MDKFDIVYKTSNKNKKFLEKRQFKILIVDDDSYVASTLATILQQRGHNVTYLSEGASCIGKCQDNKYDIIFLDFHLGDMSGVDVADILKDVLKLSSIIFAFTGDDSAHALSQFKNIGMTGAIIKPVDASIIDRLMSSLEDRRELDTRIVKSITTKNTYSKHYLFVF